MQRQTRNLVISMLIGSASSGVTVKALAATPVEASGDVKTEVDAVVHRALARCRTVDPHGIVVLSFSPPTLEDVADMRATGPAGVQYLAVHLDDQSDFSQLITMKILIALGDLDPLLQTHLEKGLTSTRWAPVRLASMDALSRLFPAAFQATVPSLEGDKDPLVAQRAHQMVVRSSSQK